MRRSAITPVIAAALVAAALVVVGAPPASAADPTWSDTTMDYENGSAMATLAADFDGDGKLDVAVIRASGDGINIYLGAGDGTFPNDSGHPDPPDVPVHGNYAVSGTAADLDGDGDIDIAYGADNVFLLFNDGHGNFTGPSTGISGVSAVYDWTGITAADIDGDADIDLLAGASALLALVVLVNDGHGNFTANSLTTGSAYDVAVADLNGDGKQDAVTSADGVGGYYSYLGNGTGGFTQVDHQADGGSSSFPKGIAAVDLNGDHVPDIVVVRNTGIAVHLGQGDGTFGPLISVPTPAASNEHLTTADLDGDGDLDLVATPSATGIADPNVSIRLNDGTGHFSAPSTALSLNDGAGPSAAADFDGDCRTDLYIGAPGGTRDTILRNTTTPYSPCRATNLTATLAGSASASVAFTAAPSNGSTVTSYTMTASPGGAMATGSASPITVSGLSAGTAYTFKVKATNAKGTGPQSGASNAVTPTAPASTPVPTSTPAPTTTTIVAPSTTTTTTPPAPSVEQVPPTAGGTGAVRLSDGSASWAVDPKGKVTVTGTAEHEGDASDRKLNAPVTGIGVTPSSNGYWLVGEDGGVFTYGDARFYGSLGGSRLDAKVVDLVPSTTGKGYLLVDTKGHVTAFGDANDLGDRTGKPLAAPVAGLTPTASGKGYWLLGEDGGVFTYGDARFFGAKVPAGRKAVLLVPSATGRGYVIHTDGSLTTSFGDATGT